MKSLLICLLITVFALSFFAGLSGCATGPFRLKITPMKIEINAPEIPSVPIDQKPIELILK